MWARGLAAGDQLIPLEGPSGCGKSTLLAKVASLLAESPVVDESGAKVIYICKEEHMAMHATMGVLLSSVCNSYHADTGVLEGYVGDASWATAGAVLEAATSFGQDVLLVLDGFNRQNQHECTQMFEFLQRRNPRLAKPSPFEKHNGCVKIIMSSTGFSSPQMHRILLKEVPPLTLHERIQVCWKLFSDLGAGDLPLDDVVRNICLEKRGSAECRYLKVLTNYLVQSMKYFPGQLSEVLKTCSDTLDGLYEHDVLPLVEIVCGEDCARNVLLALCQCHTTGLLPCELKLAASPGDGVPMEDATLLTVLDVIGPYALAPGRLDGLVSLSCATFRSAIVTRFRNNMRQGKLDRARQAQREGYNAAATHQLRSQMEQVRLR